VLPGLIATGKGAGNARFGAGAPLGPHPLRRYGALEEVASLVSYLASPAAAYITGACIPIDGDFSSMS